MVSTSTTSERTADERAILAVLDGLRRAHHEKDAAAIAACYAADAVICDLSPPLAHYGVDVAAKQEWLDGWAGPIEIEPGETSLTVDGDLAVLHGYTQMSGTPNAAGRRISFWLRDTICLRRRAGEWRIAHLHSSVPFHMDGSLRPAFDLQP
ncbi:MAG TPA: nuclear transport factor 2 family protein [Acetobacteraceae bacterium]|nr:nuclear transport factor 2 family protein [Acetobacteraceae bacterium]